VGRQRADCSRSKRSSVRPPSGKQDGDLVGGDIHSFASQYRPALQGNRAGPQVWPHCSSLSIKKHSERVIQGAFPRSRMSTHVEAWIALRNYADCDRSRSKQFALGPCIEVGQELQCRWGSMLSGVEGATWRFCRLENTLARGRESRDTNLCWRHTSHPTRSNHSSFLLRARPYAFHQTLEGSWLSSRNCPAGPSPSSSSF
jgi:hypothetical protein